MVPSTSQTMSHQRTPGGGLHTEGRGSRLQPKVDGAGRARWQTPGAEAAAAGRHGGGSGGEGPTSWSRVNRRGNCNPRSPRKTEWSPALAIAGVCGKTHVSRLQSALIRSSTHPSRQPDCCQSASRSRFLTLDVVTSMGRPLSLLTRLACRVFQASSKPWATLRINQVVGRFAIKDWPESGARTAQPALQFPVTPSIRSSIS